VITALTLVSVISTTVILIAIAVNPTLSNGLLTHSFIFKPVLQTSQQQSQSTIFTSTPVSTETGTATITTITPSPAAPATTTTVITGTAPAATATTPAAPISDEDKQKLMMKVYEELGKEDIKFMEQQFPKQKYISEQFARKDLTQEEKKVLWRQQLEYEYANLVNTNKNLQKGIDKLTGILPPETIEEFKNLLIINKRFIQQRDKMTIEYPVFYGTFNPETIASIKLQIKLIIEQKQIIQQELLKAGLSNDEKRALEQQLVILQKQQDELPPKAGNYLYDAYTASNK
jgi:hypothetical protein